ncbi:MAG: hypothetical protein KF914_06495 [Rhizobiaceae bacterium]|nr:hypothetical protein [Rhizobiaceae bacterium]
MRLQLAYAVAGLLVFAAGAQAVELRHITVRKGIDGLDAAPLTVTNRAATPIVCVAELAHWYSAELGRAETGAELRIDLWRDPSTGAFVALNDKQENMPVEALWCGLEGRSYQTRAAIRLDRTRGGPVRSSVGCSEKADRLVCG